MAEVERRGRFVTTCTAGFPSTLGQSGRAHSSGRPGRLNLQHRTTQIELRNYTNTFKSLSQDHQLPVVISSALSTIKKARLLEVLKNHKGAIAWSIGNIKGIDSSFCTHKILMEDEFKPSV
ncbi:hypothetical protein Tco_1316359 [Tanacetum coccineum]